jgi:hypothetical protein
MTARLERACAVRDHTLRLISSGGQITMIGPDRCVTLKMPPWSFAFRSPFGNARRAPSLPENYAYEAAMVLQKKEAT